MADIFSLFKQIEKEKVPPKPITHLIVGLGNPGDKYTYTRHNCGFLCMDYISQKLNTKIDKLKFKALVGEATVGDTRVLLMKPQTFMNNSGEAVSEAAAFYKIAPENIIVIFDDISFPAGRMRIRRKGSDGGHNGIKSIIYHLSSDNFPRIKVGVGTPTQGYDLIDWVLGKIPENEREDLYSCIEKVYEALPLMVKGDIDLAMGTYNSR